MKPHVRAFRSDVKRAWLASKTERAWLTVADLAERGNSEDVRLKAAKVFIEADAQARAAMPEQARQLVQIVTQNVNVHGQLTASQLPGVVEAEAYQPVGLISYNSDQVVRPDSDDEEAP